MKRRNLVVVSTILLTLALALPAHADTGYSNVFTVDLRSGAYSAALQGFGDERTATAVSCFPGATVTSYYQLRDGSGSPLNGSSISYRPSLGGLAAPSGSYSWRFVTPGVVGLDIACSSLGLGAGANENLTFPSGSGLMTIDGTPVEITASAPTMAIARPINRYVDEWDLFAAGSAGATGALGFEGKLGAAKASLAAASLSVNGSAGMGLHLALDPDDNLKLERRVELSAAASLEVPSISAELEHVGKVTGPGLRAGAKAGKSRAQAFAYRGTDGPLSDRAKIMNAGFFLESASLGGLVTSPFLAPLIRATANTLNNWSGASDLLKRGLREESASGTIGGSVGASLGSLESPSLGQQRMGFEIGASISGALKFGNTKLYGETGAAGGVVGVRSSATLALSGDVDAADLNWLFDLQSFGVGSYAGDLTESLGLSSSGSPEELTLQYGAQSGRSLDIALFHDSDYSSHQVTVAFSKPAVVNAIVSDSRTGIAALKGSLTTPFVFGWQAMTSGLDRAKTTAESTAGSGVAYTVSIEKRSGRVLGLTPEFSIPVVPPPLSLSIDLGLDLEYEKMRSVPLAGRVAVTGDGASWTLQRNTATPSWRDAPEVTAVLGERVFSGLGPLMREALGNVLGWFSGILGSSSRAQYGALGTIDVSVEDPVSGLRAGTARFDQAYAGYGASLVAGNPARLEVVGPAAQASGASVGRVRWAYTTRRILEPATKGSTAKQLARMAAASSTVLTLVGDFAKVRATDQAGKEVAGFAHQVTLELPLYQDQVQEMGGDASRLADVRVYRYDPVTLGWEKVGGTVNGSRDAVTAAITTPGIYAPGQERTIPANDSDDDGIPDSQEDANGNGVLDTGESNPYAWDTDGDGVSDGAEVAAGTDPLDASSSPNRAPVLAYIGNRSVEVGTALDLQLHALDPDGDGVRYSASGLPSGASLSPTTGSLTWSPSGEGTWRVTVTVTDQPPAGRGRALTDSETLLLIARPGAPGVAQAGQHTYLIPASAHVSGLSGTSWVSDVVLHNQGSADAHVNLYFLESGRDNSGAHGQRRTVLAGESVRLGDVVDATFAESSAAGALLVGCDEPLVVTSRTYNNATSGTYGQFIAGVPVSEASGANQNVRLIQLTRNADYRTNIGFANATGKTLNVEVKLYRNDGSSIANTGYGIQPYGFYQQTDIIGTDVSDAYAVVSSSTSGAKFFTYASVIDNRTGDPVFVTPGAGTVSAGQSLYIPGSAHVTGTGGAQWRSDVEFHNPGSTTAGFKIELLKRDQGNPSPRAKSFNLSPGRSVRYTDALSSLFGFTGAAALRITPSSGTITVTSRTYNQTSKGTYGQFIPAAPASAAIGHGDSVPVIQLSDSASTTSGYRTNIGFVNTSSKTITVVADLYDGAGVKLGSKNVTLAAYEYKQVDRIFRSVTSSTLDNCYAILTTTTSGGAFLAYGSVVDNRSGDPVYVPATGSGGGGGTCQIAVTSPNGGEAWETGSTHAVTWTKSGSGCGATIKAELLKGSQLVSTIRTSTPNDGALSWDIPTSLSAAGNYRVRLTDLGGTGANDTSNGYFSLTGGTCTYSVWPTSVSVGSGGGSGTLSVSTQSNCTWTARSNVSWVTLNRTSGTGAGTVIYTAAANSGGQRTATMSIAGRTVTVSQAAPAATCTLTVTSPNGAEAWTMGENESITWSSTGTGCGSSVKVELYRGSSSVKTVASSTNNDGSISWTVPTNLSQADDYRIKITDTSDASRYDFSNAYFTILQTPPPLLIFSDDFNRPDSETVGNGWVEANHSSITTTPSISSHQVLFDSVGWGGEDLYRDFAQVIDSWEVDFVPIAQSASDHASFTALTTFFDSADTELGSIMYFHHDTAYTCPANTPTQYCVDTQADPAFDNIPRHFSIPVSQILTQDLAGITPAAVAYTRIRLYNHSGWNGAYAKASADNVKVYK